MKDELYDSLKRSLVGQSLHMVDGSQNIIEPVSNKNVKFCLFEPIDIFAAIHSLTNEIS